MGRGRYRIHDRVQWLPRFAHPANAQILLDSLTFLQRRDRLILYGDVILENHCHLLAAGPDLGKAMGRFESFTAGRIVRRLKERRSPVLELLDFHKARHKVDREHQVRQEGSHPQ